MIANQHLMAIGLGACLLGLSALGSQKNPVERPFKGHGYATGIATLDEHGAIVAWEASGEARFTHLGQATLRAEGHVNESGVLFIEVVATAANGDQLFYGGSPGQTLIYFSGGTGRFEGALGSFIEEDEVVWTPGPGPRRRTADITASFEGTISYGPLTARKEVFVQGPKVGGQAFHGANGISMDAAGRLYVASGIGREIVILKREDGSFIERLGSAQGVLGPDDLTFGPDGSLYWTDLAAGEVGRRTPDGTVTKQFVGPGVNPITFSADGRLFVGQAFLGDGLWVLDPNLEQPPKEIIDAPGQLNAFDFGPDGKLYSPANAIGALVRIDVDTRTITPLASLGLIAAVKFDATQQLWALSRTQNALLRVNRDSGAIEQAIPMPGNMDNFVSGPGPDVHLYVTIENGGLLEVSPDGTIRELRAGGLANPGGVAVARVGDQEVVVVADLFSMEVYDAVTAALCQRHDYAALGVTPMAVSASPAGMVVSGWLVNFGAPVLEWDLANGVPLRRVAVPDVPLNAVEFQGKLVVAEWISGSIAQYAGGERTVLAGGFLVPTGLAASADSLYAADWASGTIHQVVAAGRRLSPTRIIASGLQNPEGMALDPHGHLLVVATGTKSLVRVNVRTGAMATVAMDLAVGAASEPGASPTWMFDGVAVAPSGAIYVSSYGENAIYRIRE